MLQDINVMLFCIVRDSCNVIWIVREKSTFYVQLCSWEIDPGFLIVLDDLTPTNNMRNVGLNTKV